MKYSPESDVRFFREKSNNTQSTAAAPQSYGKYILEKFLVFLIENLRHGNIYKLHQLIVVLLFILHIKFEDKLSRGCPEITTSKCKLGEAISCCTSQA